MQMQPSRPPSPEIGATVFCAETGRPFVIARDGCSFTPRLLAAPALARPPPCHLSPLSWSPFHIYSIEDTSLER